MSDITNVGPQDPMLAFIERAARDPAFSVEKVEALLRLQVEQQKRVALREFIFDQNAMQAELTQIAKDRPNPAFHSKYASLEAIDKAARPIYAKYGFSVSFGTAPASQQGWVHITCRLSHRGGHTEEHSLEGPVSLEGGRGGRIAATPIQSVGSTVTYLRRYLIQLVLNLVATNDPEDTDGEHLRTDGAPAPSYDEIAERFVTAAARITSSDEAQKLLDWKPGVMAITGLPPSDAKRAYMAARQQVTNTWIKQPDTDQPAV